MSFLTSAATAFENALKTLKPPRPKMPALHAVHEEEQLLFIAQAAQAEQVFGSCLCHASLALNAFNHDCNGRRRNGIAHCVEIVERRLPKARNHRLEAFPHLVLARGRNAGERAAMKRVD